MRPLPSGITRRAAALAKRVRALQNLAFVICGYRNEQELAHYVKTMRRWRLLRDLLAEELGKPGGLLGPVMCLEESGLKSAVPVEEARLAPERTVAEWARENAGLARLEPAERFQLMGRGFLSWEQMMKRDNAAFDVRALLEHEKGFRQLVEGVRKRAVSAMFQIPPGAQVFVTGGQMEMPGDGQRRFLVLDEVAEKNKDRNVLAPSQEGISPPGRAASADAGSSEDGTAFLSVGVADRSKENRAGAVAATTAAVEAGGAA